MFTRLFLSVSLFAAFALTTTTHLFAEPLSLRFSAQKPTRTGSTNFHRIEQPGEWNPNRTALILCDVWDSHHCRRAVLRLEEMIPRLDQVTRKLRESGVTVIHAPSDCMNFYSEHPARHRAKSTPAAGTYPEEIDKWCYKIPSEEAGVYPIDQSNGGEDDEPQEHADWIAELARTGRNPKTPWLRQHSGIHIDENTDFITDKGIEVWNVLNAKGIDNVILAGVHTNMCILGRPFGLRHMVQAGKKTTLIRDLTDTMYDPNSAPYVSHFTGTDLIIDHIERHVCPTISSEQFLGGTAFRFQADTRPTIAILVGDNEYQSESTLPKWSLDQLGKDYRVRYVHGSENDSTDFPGIQSISEADLLIVSVRRRPMKTEQLQIVRAFEASGKPMLGIRTASHAFSLRNVRNTAEGVASWPEFDNQVWGGNYSDHHPNDLTPSIRLADPSMTHPITDAWGREAIVSSGSLYKVQPLVYHTSVLLTGSILDAPTEPVLWTFHRENGGRSVYTSLGHPDDFKSKQVNTVLKRSVDWLLSTE